MAYEQGNKTVNPSIFGSIWGTGISWKGFVIFLILLGIVGLLYLHNTGSLVSSLTISAGATSAGVSIFAVLYVLAQVDERVVEPFSNWNWFGGHDVPNATSPADISHNSARVVSLWFLASGIGIFLCYITVGLFGIIGITFSGSLLQGHLIDSIISGIIIGAGTKPLHDFINIVDGKGT